MTQLRTIEIDFDIYKLIESERQSFDEPPHIALRRLLSLPEETQQKKETTSLEPILGRPFTQEGISIPHGSYARMQYLRGAQIYEGKFLDGALVVDSKKYFTLSSAASALAITKDGAKTNLNGWMYWEAKFPEATDWIALSDLRAKALKLRSPAKGSSE